MNRKDWLKIAGLLGLGATGFGLAGMGPLGSLLGGAGAAGAAGAGAAGTAGASAAGAGALEGALTAAMTPGLSATGAGSQAAMLAAQNSGMGLSALAKTAEAAAAAPGLSPMAQFGGNALAMGDKVLGGMGTASKVAAPMQMAGLLGGGQPPPPMPAPPMQQMAPPPPQDSNYGYPAPGGGGMKPPNIPQHVWDSLDPATKQKLLMGGMS